MNEVRSAFRRLLAKPGFTAVALTILTLCIGANLTIFAVIDTVLLRPLPFPESDKLVTMYNAYPKMNAHRAGSTIPNYYERRMVIPAFSSLSIYGYGSAIVGGAGATKRENVMRVSPDFFNTLGVHPAVGRAFTEEETTLEADNVVILTDAYWREHLNADTNVLNRAITVDNISRKVIGVLPKDFHFLSYNAGLFLPFASSSAQRSPQRRHMGNGDHIIARLKSGATLYEAQAQIDAHNAELEKNSRVVDESGFHTVVARLHDDHVQSIRPTLLFLQGAVVCLLLIGIVNLINLLLVRSSGRTKEIAIRQSLGATSWHVIKHIVAEISLLMPAGCLLGLVAASWGIRFLMTLGVDQLPLGASVSLNDRLVVVGILSTIALGFLMIIPLAWFNLGGRDHLADVLRSASRGGTSSHAAQSLRYSFIVAQISLAFVLLACAGLLSVSLKKAMAVSPGFRVDHVLTGHISLPSTSYPDVISRNNFASRLIDLMEQQTGISAAGAITVLPLTGAGHVIANTPVGAKARVSNLTEAFQTYGVAGNYFEAMEYKLYEGRFLTSDDSRRDERVCVVDINFARRHWPEGTAIGQYVYQGPARAVSEQETFRIVGVVGGVKQFALTERESIGAVYYPYRDRASDNFYLVAAHAAGATALNGSPLQSLVRTLDPNLVIDDIRSMQTRLADSLLVRRSPALVAGIFSVTALLLTAIGTYGVLSYAVSLRRREIGVRMALGALPRQILRQFLGLGAKLLLAGIAFGIFGAWAAARAAKSIIFGIDSSQLAILSATAGLMIITVLIAMLFPSYKAARIHPVEALKES